MNLQIAKKDTGIKTARNHATISKNNTNPFWDYIDSINLNDNCITTNKV